MRPLRELSVRDRNPLDRQQIELSTRAVVGVTRMRVKIGRPNEERKAKELLAKLEQLKFSKKKSSDNRGTSTQRKTTDAEDES